MEIGSVLELDDYRLYEKNENPIIDIPLFRNDRLNYSCFQSGRNAIEELTRLLLCKGISNFYVPEFVCSTVPDAILRGNGSLVTYQHLEDGSIDLESINNNISTNNSCFYFVHLFGRKLSSKEFDFIQSLKQSNILIIEDITMSLLSVDPKYMGFGDYIIGSLRKWFPVPDGGFVASQETTLPKEPANNSISLYSHYYYITQEMKRSYIANGERDFRIKETYLSYYAKSTKELFSDYSIYPISEISRDYISNCNVDKIIEKRLANYDFLYESLKNTSIKPFIERKLGYVPFGMVVTVDKRDLLLEYLRSHDIYCNIHWRISGTVSKTTQYFTQTLLTIPCDQRYSTKDMERIINCIKDFLNDRN